MTYWLIPTFFTLIMHLYASYLIDKLYIFFIDGECISYAYCETCDVKDSKDFSQVQNMWGEVFDKDGERPRKGQRGCLSETLKSPKGMDL